MLVLILLSFPISLFSVVNQVAALNLAGGGGAAGSAGTLAALDGPQRDALAYLALQLHHKELMVAEIFWGLWLFPFGICVMRSGFIPRFLGILLMIAGFDVADAFAEFALPQFMSLTTRLTGITNFARCPSSSRLLIWGAEPQRASPRAA